MLPETRRRQLLELISRQGSATLEELVKSLGVSESTVRRDLESLDLAGVGQADPRRGGLRGRGPRDAGASTSGRRRRSTEKRAIGRATAGLLEDGDTVLLDGGTTTLEVARALIGRPIQVVTNSLPIAQLLASSQQTDLILIGGYVYPRTGVAMGPLAIATMQGIRVRKAILGAGGIMRRRGLQLEPAAGRDRAADDGLRTRGGDRGRLARSSAGWPSRGSAALKRSPGW